MADSWGIILLLTLIVGAIGWVIEYFWPGKALEVCWLLAAVMLPLFFNVYSSRVFEPDKIALLRSLALIMLVLWIVKLVNGGVRSAVQSNAPTRTGKAAAAVQGAAQSGLPSWLGWLRVPLVIPIFVYALVYIFSSLFTLTPEPTWFGSYQRLQGTYSQFSYMTLGIVIMFNMRSRKQVERLINFIILTSIPITLYGLLQANRLDPLPWAGDTATRVASTMGNAIFVAAWLIMAVPLTIYRFLNGVSGMGAARDGEPEGDEQPNGAQRNPNSRQLTAARRSAYQEDDYGWALVANVVGLLMVSMFVFMSALKMVAGLPFPDAALWWAVPSALIVFYLICWAIEGLSNRRYDPLQRTYLLMIGALLFIVSMFAFVINWDINTATITAQIDFNGINNQGFWSGFWWILFFMLSWGAVAGLAYAFGGAPDEAPMRRMGLLVVFTSVVFDIAFLLMQPDAGVTGLIWALFFVFAWGAASALAYFFGWQNEDNPDPRQGMVALAANTGYGLLIAIQLITIYLTQSRGPWLGIGMGILVFALALFFVGRSRGVRWMARAGGWVSGGAFAVAIPIIALNLFVNLFNAQLPSAVVEIPLVGRAIERLSTLTRTEDGTGKVRTLIWKGATDLIVSDSIRAIIGYGPEAMYVAYNKFYPPELAQWELRNATPDRSHNVEFDHMVTMGVFGLAAYYFIVASFYWYALRIIRRARTSRDQLLGIALVAMMTAHFIEIQTGIQIASTWSYFYITLGMMVAFGFYVTGYLREDNSAAVESAYADDRRQTTDDRQSNLKSEIRNPKSVGVSPSTSTRSQQSTEARRRQAAQTRIQLGSSEGEWTRNPAFLIVYAVLLLGAMAFIWSVNVATVQADTYYKQGQSYDNAQRYLCTDDACSIPKYDKAIKLQPNQDYYYLFRGRAYLEFSKQIEQQVPEGTSAQQIDDYRTKYLKLAEESLLHAQSLNPMNTDHYANLGRLYLYWADPTGGKDSSKATIALENMEKATQHSPGNAQLWNELGVAYSRTDQFDRAIDALEHSQIVDPTFARTPFVKGQLIQERAVNVKNALMGGIALPVGGETDYSTLLLAVGQAFSESITLDPAFFVDNGMQERVDYFLSQATQPFMDTKKGTLVDPVAAHNVLTDTIAKAYEQLKPKYEKSLATYLRKVGAYTGSKDFVPAEVLDGLWANPSWAGKRLTGSTKEWLDDEMFNTAHRAVVPYAALGYIKFKLYNPEDQNLTPERKEMLSAATADYQRAVTIDPSNYFNQKNLGSLYVEQGQHLAADKQCVVAKSTYEEGLKHLEAGLAVVQSQPDVEQDATKKEDLKQIQADVDRANLLIQQPCP